MATIFKKPPSAAQRAYLKSHGYLYQCRDLSRSVSAIYSHVAVIEW